MILTIFVLEGYFSDMNLDIHVSVGIGVVNIHYYLLFFILHFTWEGDLR
jgi:hypothetical protein